MNASAKPAMGVVVVIQALRAEPAVDRTTERLEIAAELVPKRVDS